MMQVVFYFEIADPFCFHFDKVVSQARMSYIIQRWHNFMI